jgi:hypothetical protein
MSFCWLFRSNTGTILRGSSNLKTSFQVGTRRPVRYHGELDKLGLRGVNVVSVNLIFHVVSALTFVLLIWYLLHLQAQRAFLRMLLSSLTLAQPRVVVDWPQAFVRKLASAQGLPFSSEAKDMGQAQRIDVKLWAEVHATLGLESVEWQKGSLRLGVRRSSGADLESWRLRLEASLQGKMKIEWV